MLRDDSSPVPRSVHAFSTASIIRSAVAACVETVEFLFGILIFVVRVKRAIYQNIAHRQPESPAETILIMSSSLHTFVLIAPRLISVTRETE
jgi:hypothetical protein